jgi:hypothetical protein
MNILLYDTSSPLSINPLQDAGWVGVIVAIVIGIATIGTTVAITIWAVRKQRNQKEVMYQVVSDVPIVSISEEVIGRVKILFDGFLIEDMNLLVLKVWNSGSVAVKRDDFDEPITFEFEGRKLVGSEILSMNPSDLIDSKDTNNFLTFGTETIQLQKFLLNPKDEVNLKVLLKEFAGRVKGRARIVDGKIKEFDPNNRVSIFPLGLLLMIILAIVLFSVGLIYAFINISSNSISVSMTLIISGILGLVLGGLAVYALIVTSRSIKRV